MRGDRFSFRFCWHQCLAFSWLRSQQQVWRRAFPIIIPDGVGKAKRKRRSGWAQSRRVTALLLWIIHSHSDRTWMAWLQLLTCAITLTLSITLSPSLTLSQTRVHRKNPDTHTHTHTLCFPFRTISCGICESWWRMIFTVNSRTPVLWKWPLKPITWIYQSELGNSVSQVCVKFLNV